MNADIGNGRVDVDVEMTDILLDVLSRAAEAHGVYEAKLLGGLHDPDWPQWYAEHMAQTLHDTGYRLIGP
jgi:hypothetical protein